MERCVLLAIMVFLVCIAVLVWADNIIKTTSPEPTKTVAMFTEETQELKRTCHFLRCLYVAEDKLGMELVCSQTPAICPPEERIDQ